MQRSYGRNDSPAAVSPMEGNSDSPSEGTDGMHGLHGMIMFSFNDFVVEGQGQLLSSSNNSTGFRWSYKTFQACMGCCILFKGQHDGAYEEVTEWGLLFKFTLEEANGMGIVTHPPKPVWGICKFLSPSICNWWKPSLSTSVNIVPILPTIQQTCYRNTVQRYIARSNWTAEISNMHACF